VEAPTRAATDVKLVAMRTDQPADASASASGRGDEAALVVDQAHGLSGTLGLGCVGDDVVGIDHRCRSVRGQAGVHGTQTEMLDGSSRLGSNPTPATQGPMPLARGNAG